jgi:hypothetical protein
MTFLSWSFVSMMLLISSRIIFTFSDVSDSGKEVVAVILIIFLLLILIRTLVESIQRRAAKDEPCLITPGLIDSLQEQERIQLSRAMMDYHVMHRKRVVELSQSFAQSANVSSIFPNQKKDSAQSKPSRRKIIVVSDLADAPPVERVRLE